MPAIPLRAMVLCANPGRLLRYGALFNRCGYFHLSLCLDRRELRRSLDQGYPYDYFLYDGFRLDQGCKGTLACWDAAAASGASCWWANSIAARSACCSSGAEAMA